MASARADLLKSKTPKDPEASPGGHPRQARTHTATSKAARGVTSPGFGSDSPVIQRVHSRGIAIRPRLPEGTIIPEKTQGEKPLLRSPSSRLPPPPLSISDAPALPASGGPARRVEVPRLAADVRITFITALRPSLHTRSESKSASESAKARSIAEPGSAYQRGLASNPTRPVSLATNFMSDGKSTTEAFWFRAR